MRQPFPLLASGAVVDDASPHPCTKGRCEEPALTIMFCRWLVPAFSMVVCTTAPQSPPPNTRSLGFALHFDDIGEATRAKDRLARSGEERLCDARDDRDCMELRPATESPGIVYVRPPAVGSGDGVVRSVGDAFDEAYELRERSGARRAEPLLRVAIPRSQTASEQIGRAHV